MRRCGAWEPHRDAGIDDDGSRLSEGGTKPCNAFGVGHATALLAGSAAFLALAVIAFRRRDLAA